MLLPFSENTSPEYLLEKLEERINNNIQNTEEKVNDDDGDDYEFPESGSGCKLYFIFGSKLENVLDTDNFHMLEEHPGLKINIPKNIKFIGSLSEVCFIFIIFLFFYFFILFYFIFNLFIFIFNLFFWFCY